MELNQPGLIVGSIIILGIYLVTLFCILSKVLLLLMFIDLTITNTIVWSVPERYRVLNLQRYLTGEAVLCVHLSKIFQSRKITLGNNTKVFIVFIDCDGFVTHNLA